MFRKRMTWITVFICALAVLTPALGSAKSIHLKDAGPIIVMFPILLLLVPVLILFVGFIAKAFHSTRERKGMKKPLLN